MSSWSPDPDRRDDADPASPRSRSLDLAQEVLRIEANALGLDLPGLDEFHLEFAGLDRNGDLDQLAAPPLLDVGGRESLHPDGGHGNKARLRADMAQRVAPVHGAHRGQHTLFEG